MDNLKIKKKSREIRIEIIKMIAAAGSGHPAGSLGMADIFACLYFSVMKHKPKDPLWSERDRLILSAGHIVPVWYATLALAGYFPQKQLASYRQIDSELQGHPHRGDLPGIENTAGPLGQGVSVAVGVALAAKIQKKDWRVFCIASDGEQQEGQTWEALMMAAKYNLNNLTIIIDRNNIQISGPIEQVMPIEPLASKYQAFGWQVGEIDGHDLRAIEATLNRPSLRPKVIIAETIPGKGVDFMENDYRWHGQAPNKEEAEKALAQLR